MAPQSCGKPPQAFFSISWWQGRTRNYRHETIGTHRCMSRIWRHPSFRGFWPTFGRRGNADLGHWAWWGHTSRSLLHCTILGRLVQWATALLYCLTFESSSTALIDCQPLNQAVLVDNLWKAHPDYRVNFVQFRYWGSCQLYRILRYS